MAVRAVLHGDEWVVRGPAPQIDANGQPNGDSGDWELRVKLISLPGEELPRYASLSKAYIADAFSRIGVDCVQLHGAVGYTLEYDMQLYLKRSKWVRPMYGDSDYHRDRLATLRNL